MAESLALAPLSVLPEYQRKGVGKQLILEALDKALMAIELHENVLDNVSGVIEYSSAFFD